MGNYDHDHDHIDHDQEDDDDRQDEEMYSDESVRHSIFLAVL